MQKAEIGRGREVCICTESVCAPGRYSSARRLRARRPSSSGVPPLSAPLGLGKVVSPDSEVILTSPSKPEDVIPTVPSSEVIEEMGLAWEHVF